MRDFYEWFSVCSNRTPEGLFSAAHLITVTLAMAFVLFLATFLAKKFKGNQKAINLTLIISSLSIVFLYVLRVSNNFILFFFDGSNTLSTTEQIESFKGMIVNQPPLYLCDLAIIFSPICAFSKGRFKTILADFLAIWGFVMGFIGNYFAGNIFPHYPVFSLPIIISISIHAIPSFFALFLILTKVATFKKENMLFTILILFTTMTIALIYDYIFQAYDANFMFFFSGEGTPCDLLLILVQGNLILYQLLIYVGQCGYMFIFYGILSLVRNIKNKKNLQLSFK